MTSGGKPLHIFLCDAAVLASPDDLGEVKAELFGEMADCRNGERIRVAWCYRVCKAGSWCERVIRQTSLGDWVLDGSLWLQVLGLLCMLIA